HVTGRSTDILEIVTGSQSAIILTGAPRIGKTALIRYLQIQPQDIWSWRKEERFVPIYEPFALDRLYFMQIDLTQLGNAQSRQEIHSLFIKACIQALTRVYPIEVTAQGEDLKSLRTLLRQIERQFSGTRYFIMLDSIERLNQSEHIFAELQQSEGRNPQERGLAILNHCGAIRSMVDLIDEFSYFGVIFAITSLPRPKSVDQFTHISADLARFTTSTLQCFTWSDTTAFLAQQPEDFGSAWAQAFYNLGGKNIFTPDEQSWLRELAGTHPYLLQQCCFHTFNFKREYAQINNTWLPLPESDQKQLMEYVNQRITTFLSSLWKRLQEALEKALPETRELFQEFVSFLVSCDTTSEIHPETWDRLGPELRYIFSSEGIIRNEPFQPKYTPGHILRSYLIQRMEETTIPPQRGFWLTINRPGYQTVRVSLSELEYRLIKTLLLHTHNCSEEELMRNAWGKMIERATFTQRMHHLRKKLKEYSNDTPLIVNRYGGQYSLEHIDWLHLE
ncbi:MAG TPA: winged helix-turn-helix domain-containing protein, partial [Ktedonobacteraceae bacterium]